jgi:hypothetical protein
LPRKDEGVREARDPGQLANPQALQNGQEELRFQPPASKADAQAQAQVPTPAQQDETSKAEAQKRVLQYFQSISRPTVPDRNIENVPEQRD